MIIFKNHDLNKYLYFTYQYKLFITFNIIEIFIYLEQLKLNNVKEEIY